MSKLGIIIGVSIGVVTLGVIVSSNQDDKQPAPTEAITPGDADPDKNSNAARDSEVAITSADPVQPTPKYYPDKWSGEYSEGPYQTISIRRSPGGYDISLGTAAEGCAGGVSGYAPSGDSKNLVFANTGVDAGSCSIWIHRVGKYLKAEEGAGCQQFRGASCEFEGDKYAK